MKRPSVNKVLKDLARDIFIARAANPVLAQCFRTKEACRVQAKVAIVAAKSFYKELQREADNAD